MDEQPKQHGIKGRVMTYRQKWVAGVAVPVLLLALGWAGSWVGYTVRSGADADTRIAVAETRIGALEQSVREVVAVVKQDHDILLEIRGALDQLIARDVAPARARRARPACGPDESEAVAANGQPFCQRR